MHYRRHIFTHACGRCIWLMFWPALAWSPQGANVCVFNMSVKIHYLKCKWRRLELAKSPEGPPPTPAKIPPALRTIIGVLAFEKVLQYLFAPNLTGVVDTLDRLNSAGVLNYVDLHPPAKIPLSAMPCPIARPWNSQWHQVRAIQRRRDRLGV